MALERVGKFIAEEIAGLPESHPHRKFLQDLLQTTEAVIGTTETVVFEEPKEVKKRPRLPKVFVNPRAHRTVDVFTSPENVEAQQLRLTDPKLPRNNWGYTKLTSELFLGNKRDGCNIENDYLRGHVVNTIYRGSTRQGDNRDLWNLVDAALNTLPEDLYTVVNTRYSLHEREQTDTVPVNTMASMHEPPLPQTAVNTHLRQAFRILRHPSRSLPIARHIDTQPRNPQH